MNEQNRTILIIASRLLNYPTDSSDEKQNIYECIEEDITNKTLKEELTHACDELFKLSPLEREELYVFTFDLKSKQCLYLTAHELGDSTKRGAALIKLQKIVNQAGFEREVGELADYIPMLFEFLAVVPGVTPDIERLSQRLGVAIYRILENIDKENPYTAILTLLMDYIFPVPTQEQIEKLEFDREEADLEELPYPIMYQ